MKSFPLPPSGPIHVDCREQAAMTAIRNLDDTMRRMRPGARVFVVRVASPDVLDAAVRWARIGRAPHEVVETSSGTEVRMYLLPTELGGHPSAAFARPGLEQAVSHRRHVPAAATDLGAELQSSV